MGGGVGQGSHLLVGGDSCLGEVSKVGIGGGRGCCGSVIIGGMVGKA